MKKLSAWFVWWIWHRSNFPVMIAIASIPVLFDIFFPNHPAIYWLIAGIIFSLYLFGFYLIHYHHSRK